MMPLRAGFKARYGFDGSWYSTTSRLSRDDQLTSFGSVMYGGWWRSEPQRQNPHGIDAIRSATGR